MSNNKGRILLDNGGGVTLQLGKYGHYYDSPQAAARDLVAFFGAQNVETWEGHEVEALRLDPSSEEMSNGGYRSFRFSVDDDILGVLYKKLAVSGWANGSSMAEEIDRLIIEYARAGRDLGYIQGLRAWESGLSDMLLWYTAIPFVDRGTLELQGIPWGLMSVRDGYIRGYNIAIERMISKEVFLSLPGCEDLTGNEAFKVLSKSFCYIRNNRGFIISWSQIAGEFFLSVDVRNRKLLEVFSA